MIEIRTEVPNPLGQREAVEAIQLMVQTLQSRLGNRADFARWQVHGRRIQLQMATRGIESRWRADVFPATVAITGLIATTEQRHGKVLRHAAIRLVQNALKPSRQFRRSRAA